MSIIIKFKKTIILSLLLVCFCIVSFVAGMKYNSNQKLYEDRKYYLNHFYSQLDNTIRLLSSVDDWGNSIHYTDISVNPYRQLLNDLNSMKVINKQSKLYMMNDRDSYFLNNLAQTFNLIENSIGSGITWNNQLLCVDFLKDGALSKNEISFLASLKQDLQSMKSSLYSEDTKQENPNLTMKEVSKIVKPFTDKYSNLTSIGLSN